MMFHQVPRQFAHRERTIQEDANKCVKTSNQLVAQAGSGRWGHGSSLVEMPNLGFLLPLQTTRVLLSLQLGRIYLARQNRIAR
jgi:hypothetical protein